MADEATQSERANSRRRQQDSPLNAQVSSLKVLPGALGSDITHTHRHLLIGLMNANPEQLFLGNLDQGPMRSNRPDST